MTTTAAPKPRTLGSYEIVDKIAEGSMCTVHRARHRETGEVVAVKVLSSQWAGDPVMRERLHQEFRAARAVTHPNLVRAIDGGEEDGTFYLVMEYVPGEDLWQRVARGGALPEAEAVRVMVQVAQALHAAHSRGIIHRDVKPDNILLAADGTAKLADLGLVKDLEGSVELTRPEQGLGTPNYMAPEQFRDARRAGVLCDVYSAGATLYAAVTGELPFPAKAVAGVLRKKVADELVPPRQLVPALSERLDFAIRRAVRANPAERHASILEFAAALTGDAAPARYAKGPAVRPAGEEKRVSVRYSCDLDTRCNRNTSLHVAAEGDADSWEATVRDLSVTGVRLVVNRRFERGTLLAFDLRSSNGGYTRSVEARVKWVGKAGAGSWSHGCLFSEALTKDELRKLV
jgi:serine/threonine protein kinase